MRSVQVTRLEGPSGVEVVEAAEPTRGEDEVLVEVRALGMSWPDLLQSRGEYQLKPDLPFQLGVDFAGVVREAPTGSGLAAGDRVACVLPYGGGADLVAVHQGSVFPLPDGVSFEKAAAMPMNYLTAQFALEKRGQLREGETVLVHGAAGGVGTATLQVARGYGARTVAVVSTEEKADFVRSLGADHAVLTDGFLAAVKEITEGRGVDVVVDVVGGDLMTDSLRALAPLGRLLVLGFTGGADPAGQGEPAAAQQRRRPRRRLGCLRDDARGLPAQAVGRAAAARGVRRGRPAGRHDVPGRGGVAARWSTSSSAGCSARPCSPSTDPGLAAGSSRARAGPSA